jgi:hypothetical protein
VKLKVVIELNRVPTAIQGGFACVDVDIRSVGNVRVFWPHPHRVLAPVSSLSLANTKTLANTEREVASSLACLEKSNKQNIDGNFPR